ncbi:hypothetical protein PRZ48_007929 [Zasmidium cellare]|uniref:Mannosylglycerate hydrolase MGH1-like glycoside hydrolase domain-containing protein n=1 Tax=Zasmidium cellare TaxID=395010 RepID=A0ABR0EEW1_ZASCE|nr:hypothetical protein PRZ48_007929 [Zasmidium cellare]
MKSQFLAYATAASLAVPFAVATAIAKRSLDTTALASQYFGNHAPWYQDRIPFFTCSDKSIQGVHYYRWKVFRAHQRDLGERGYVSTEFLDDVGWQLEPWATLNDATGFHIGEGRWLRDRRFADDYIRHMYNGGNDRHFTDYMADSWDDSFDTDKGLYWREPLADATEYTISSIDASCGVDGFTGGYAFRPSINSYMWANAIAMNKIAALTGENGVASDFQKRADTLKERFQADIWNTTLEHFIDRHQRDTDCVKYWEPIRGRELVGLVPWMFNMPDDNSTYSAAWKHLLDTDKLRGSNGMRTNEPSYEYYMRQYRYDQPTGLRECQWNGPVWPYQITQVLLGMANLLDTYDQEIITKANFIDELRRYTNIHYLNGEFNIQEDYEPDKTGPIVGLPRSHHYFHSGYNDIIISGLVGIRPRADNVIEVNPMIPEGSDITSFRIQDVPYHGHSVAVQWEASGSGLQVEVDGTVLASASQLGRLTADIPAASAPAIERRIAKSIQLVRGDFPKGSASSGNDTERIHDAIDGGVWFFPELPNGWDSDGTETDSEQWYAIEFASPTEFTGAELAFFANGDDFALPKDYSIQQFDGSNWVDVWDRPQLVENGLTAVEGDSVTTGKIRVAFTQLAGKKTRLVEFKLF